MAKRNRDLNASFTKKTCSSKLVSSAVNNAIHIKEKMEIIRKNNATLMRL